MKGFEGAGDPVEIAGDAVPGVETLVTDLEAAGVDGCFFLGDALIGVEDVLALEMSITSPSSPFFISSSTFMIACFTS